MFLKVGHIVFKSIRTIHLYIVPWWSICSAGCTVHSCAGDSQSCMSSPAPHTADLSSHVCDGCLDTWIFQRSLRLKEFQTFISLHTPKSLFNLSILPLMALPYVQCPNGKPRNLNWFLLEHNPPIWLSNEASECFLYHSFQICSSPPIHPIPPHSVSQCCHCLFSVLWQKIPNISLPLAFYFPIHSPPNS